jgi:mannosidase alpha-like ER degradation enhancer 2
MLKLRALPLLILAMLATVSPARADDPAITAETVKEQLVHAWQGYVQYAWGHDSLKPLSHGAHDWYPPGTLLMTPVDALDTMIIMGLKDEAKQAHELIASRLTFDQDISISVFETTIRILGGLLSGYELTGDARLLQLADDLGRRLSPAFHSPTGMPYGRINLRTGAVSKTKSNPAEVGSLMMEFGTLARLTGKKEYYDQAKRAVTELFRRASANGLVGSEIDIESGKWTSDDSHIGGAIDSYYEYLYKSWLLFGDQDFRVMWQKSIEGINRYVADDRDGQLWYGHVNMNTGRRKDTLYGSLDAFFAGLLALSGDLDRAERLQESNYRMWNLNGIEPEALDYRTTSIVDPIYRLRPEIIESAYYLHEITGNPRYLEMGTTFVKNLMQYCRTSSGFAELADVRDKTKADSMESYFFAETLKYSYLLFAPRGTLDLRNRVLNTEAHPLRRLQNCSLSVGSGRERYPLRGRAGVGFAPDPGDELQPLCSKSPKLPL